MNAGGEAGSGTRSLIFDRVHGRVLAASSPVQITYDGSVIELHSDTVTRPTAAMRKAIAEAEVGDDMFGQDPTVNALERETAQLLGKEAAVYVPSGTMGNQTALRAMTQLGDEIIVGDSAHVYVYEAGGSAALSGLICKTLSGDRGVFTVAQLKEALRPPDQHYAPTRLVCIENTHNMGGGKIWPIEAISEIAQVAREHGLKMHLDGARLWNATAATGIEERKYASYFDSVSICFSKGLGAPVGSAVVGDEAVIEDVRRARKQFGGGMRQAGIIAAGALHALRYHRERLTEDHVNAKTLAIGLAELPGIELNPEDVETNIVRFGITAMRAGEFKEKMAERGVSLLAVGPGVMRAVTHLDVSGKDILAAIAVMGEVLRQVSEVPHS